jgi:hypothetical protein
MQEIDLNGAGTRSRTRDLLITSKCLDSALARKSTQLFHGKTGKLPQTFQGLGSYFHGG